MNSFAQIADRMPQAMSNVAPGTHLTAICTCTKSFFSIAALEQKIKHGNDITQNEHMNRST